MDMDRRCFLSLSLATALQSKRFIGSAGVFGGAVFASELGIESDHVYLPLQTSASTVNKVANSGSFGAVEYSVDGSAAGIWDYPGGITPQGDNSITLLNSIWKSFARLDDLQGGIYISFNLRIRSHQSLGSQSLISFSPYQIGNGGWEIYISPGRRVVSHYRPGNGSTENIAASSSELKLNTEHRLSVYFDPNYRQMSMYMDGEETITKWMGDSVLASISDNLDAKIFTNSASIPAKFVGLNGAVHSISHLFIARVKNNISADIPKLVSAWNAQNSFLPDAYRTIL